MMLLGHTSKKLKTYRSSKGRRRMEKDEKIITGLLCLHLITLLLVCCVDTEIDIINKSIDDIRQMQAAQNESQWHLSENVNESLAVINGRLDAVEWDNRVQAARLDAHRQALDNDASAFADLLNSTERLEEYMKSLPNNAWGFDITADEEYLVAALVYLEAGGSGCSYELQLAIATVFFNQMQYYGLTVNQAIYRAGAFSVASRVRTTKPSAVCRMAVRQVLEQGGSLPHNVIAFQLGGYHRFGHPYCKIQNVYFTQM